MFYTMIFWLLTLGFSGNSANANLSSAGYGVDRAPVQRTMTTNGFGLGGAPVKHPVAVDGFGLGG